MRNYETAVIFSASLSEQELEAEVAKVVEIIARNKGTHTGTQRWGRRLMSYPIKKQSEGIYYFVRWLGTEEVSAALDWNLRIDEKCLRHLNIRLDDSRVTTGDYRAGEEAVVAEDSSFEGGFDTEEESEQDSEE